MLCKKLTDFNFSYKISQKNQKLQDLLTKNLELGAWFNFIIIIDKFVETYLGIIFYLEANKILLLIANLYEFIFVKSKKQLYKTKLYDDNNNDNVI